MIMEYFGVIMDDMFIVYSGDIDVLVEHFLDMFHQSSMYRKQSIMALNEIVMGTTGKGRWQH